MQFYDIIYQCHSLFRPQNYYDYYRLWNATQFFVNIRMGGGGGGEDAAENIVGGHKKKYTFSCT